MQRWILAALIGLAPAGAAQAEDVSGCAKFKWSVERERAWIAAGPTPVAASGEIAVGEKAYRVSLAAGDAVKFAATPERAPKSGTRAGVLTFAVAKPGVYDVGLSGEGWIDIVQNGVTVRSSDFSGQKNCPGIRKSVRFSFAAGAATLQLSNISDDTIDVAIAPAP